MQVGDLVRDPEDGSIGLVTSEVRSYNIREEGPAGEYVMVLWPSNEGEPVRMDMAAIKNGWAEVISENR